MRKPRRLRTWVIAAVALSLLACGLVLAAGVWAWQALVGPPPGEGPRAERGYKACEPIITALAQYFAEHQAYPASLDDLRPAYLAELPAAAAEFEVQYQKVDLGYRLQFRYAGPGMNVCVYTPDKGWKCYGYY